MGELGLSGREGVGAVVVLSFYLLTGEGEGSVGCWGGGEVSRCYCRSVFGWWGANVFVLVGFAELRWRS